VVPPSIATLFVGTAHLEPVTADDGIIHQEVVTMDLTFDHRWINGVGAASFMADIRKGVEQFELPELS
jgi:pyruvate/2-oxoglutarate dehydrogenase complex dihydrolipoamide acyltransferase (E2) component